MQKPLWRIIILAILTLTPVDGWTHGEALTGFGSVGIFTTGAMTTEGVGLSTLYFRRTYKQFTDQQLLDFRRQRGEDVHQHEREETLFLTLSVGLFRNWDLNFQLPYNRFSNFKDNSDEFAVRNNTISKTDASQGVSDLLILTRYRFWQENDQHVAALFGLKVPIGNYRQTTNQGDLVGTHNQPGSGSVDFQLGLAYTEHFQDIVGVSGDLIARVNTEGAGRFRSGNAVQADLAIGFLPHAVFQPFVELNGLVQERDIENDRIKKNSGVISLFVTPGMRFTIGGRHTFFGTISFPVWLEYPGIQNKEDYRISAGYGFGF